VVTNGSDKVFQLSCFEKRAMKNFSNYMITNKGDEKEKKYFPVNTKLDEVVTRKIFTEHTDRKSGDENCLVSPAWVCRCDVQQLL
jgi:fructose-1,6-bisphosphatase